MGKLTFPQSGGTRKCWGAELMMVAMYDYGATIKELR